MSRYGPLAPTSPHHWMDLMRWHILCIHVLVHHVHVHVYTIHACIHVPYHPWVTSHMCACTCTCTTCPALCGSHMNHYICEVHLSVRKSIRRPLLNILRHCIPIKYPCAHVLHVYYASPTLLPHIYMYMYVPVDGTAECTFVCIIVYVYIRVWKFMCIAH